MFQDSSKQFNNCMVYLTERPRVATIAHLVTGEASGDENSDPEPEPASLPTAVVNLDPGMKEIALNPLALVLTLVPPLFSLVFKEDDAFDREVNGEEGLFFGGSI